jgi:hypothetical protein
VEQVAAIRQHVPFDNGTICMKERFLEAQGKKRQVTVQNFGYRRAQW